jgi:hypothetical protein
MTFITKGLVELAEAAGDVAVERDARVMDHLGQGRTAQVRHCDILLQLVPAA